MTNLVFQQLDRGIFENETSELVRGRCSGGNINFRMQGERADRRNAAAGKTQSRGSGPAKGGDTNRSACATCGSGERVSGSTAQEGLRPRAASPCAPHRQGSGAVSGQV